MIVEGDNLVYAGARRVASGADGEPENGGPIPRSTYGRHVSVVTTYTRWQLITLAKSISRGCRDRQDALVHPLVPKSPQNALTPVFHDGYGLSPAA
jgi:hypothetical protein